MRIGAVPVPVNPLYGADDYPYFVEDSGARLAIVDAVCAEKVRAPKLLLVDELEPSEELQPVDTLRDDVAFWLYSSGSTGRPKGVVHLHRDLLFTCETYARHVLGITDQDVTFSTTKLFHAYGLGNNLSFPYWAGATTVLLSGRPSPDAIFAAVERFRPTLFFSVPTLYNAMLAAERDGDFSTARLCVSAAEPLPAEVWHRWQNAHDLVILDGVGSTEMLHIYCSNTPRTLLRLEWPAGARYDVKLVDDDGAVVDGTVRRPLRPGESMLREYWNQAEKTADSIRDGWFYSRDRYRRDEQGRYWCEGRRRHVQGEWTVGFSRRCRSNADRAPGGHRGRGRGRAGRGLHQGEGVRDRARSRSFRSRARTGAPRVLRRQAPPLSGARVDRVRRRPSKTATGKIERYKLRPPV